MRKSNFASSNERKEGRKERFLVTGFRKISVFERFSRPCFIDHLRGRADERSRGAIYRDRAIESNPSIHLSVDHGFPCVRGGSFSLARRQQAFRPSNDGAIIRKSSRHRITGPLSARSMRVSTRPPRVNEKKHIFTASFCFIYSRKYPVARYNRVTLREARK